MGVADVAAPILAVQAMESTVDARALSALRAILTRVRIVRTLILAFEAAPRHEKLA